MFDEDAGELPRAPDFAEHTDEILGEIGLGASEVERLKQGGVVV
jgi:crotonobetainyl-CoA:carnitine CoA-transferase CaiB-like acyl-CoA transferase